MESLSDIQHEVVTCIRCPRLVTYSQEIAYKKRRMYQEWVYWGRPVPSYGDPEARLLIVGLAPAAHGANRTGRMFTGDTSADFLFETLYSLGFASSPTSRVKEDGMVLRDAYITSAARCAPPGNKPHRQELMNCKTYLKNEIALLSSVQVIMALGKIAFDLVWLVIQEMGTEIPSPRPKFGHGVTCRLNEITLMGSYHPSRQNTQTGRLTQAMFSSVFRKAKGMLS